MGGCLEVTLLAGVTACMSQELHNPLGREKRESYWDGITSGDPGRVAGTIGRGVGEVANVIFNPSKLAADITGFVP